MTGPNAKAYRHPTAGRLYPGRAFSANGASYPSNFLELANADDLAAHGINVSDDATLTAADIAQEAAHVAKEQRRDTATREQFEYLGRFVQHFELMIEAIRSSCLLICSANPNQQRIMHIVFGYQNMTARPLFDIFRAIVAETMQNPDTESKAADKALFAKDRTVARSVFKQMSEDMRRVTDARNDIVHGTWRIGWGNTGDEDFSNISMHKAKATASGLAFVQPIRSVNELKVQIAECDRLSAIIHTIAACLMFPKLSVSRNFKYENKKWVKIVRDS